MGGDGDVFSYNPIDTSPAARSGVSPVVVAIGAVVGILLLIILAVVLIRCRRNKDLKAISAAQRSTSAVNMNGSGGRRATDTLLSSAASRGSSFSLSSSDSSAMLSKPTDEPCGMSTGEARDSASHTMSTNCYDHATNTIWQFKSNTHVRDVLNIFVGIAF